MKRLSLPPLSGAQILVKLLTFCCTIQILSACSYAQEVENDEYAAYLFTYFVGNGPGQESIHYALSTDGYSYKALNNNEPIISSDSISTSGGVRDPHILRGADGKTFYMVVTDLYVPEQGWSNQAMVMMKSTDLINWSSAVVNIPETFPDEYGEVNRVWAPQTIYDPETEEYMLYWSMRTGNEPDIIYYAYANEDFTGLATVPKQLFYSPTNSASIDGDIVYHEGKYHLFFKNEGKDSNGIMKAVSDKLTEGYVQHDEYVDQTDEAVEGSGIFKLIGSDTYILMYDVYMNGKYQFTESKDLVNFSVVDTDISMDFHPRHGSVIPVTRREAEALVNKWGSTDKGTVSSSNSEKVKKNNIVIDEEESTIYLPVKPNTDLSSFDPQLAVLPGMRVAPASPQDFTKGPVTYTISIGEKRSKTYEVTARADNNPVLDGYYADPEVLYAQKTGKYYIYPTSDGFDRWSGNFFKTFSSDDLVNWKDEGVILDLAGDVSWTSRNAWAPTIIEKNIDGAYKYFYYFTAAQKIGVAVADDPAGPFKDSGKPLIDFRPEGITHGQEIDPDVFADPVSGKNYLYWGNGYMAVAELEDDMTSIKRNTLQVMTPDESFREGIEVFYKDGLYYFLWSVDDTRSENYRVHYATADSPTGKLSIPENNVVIVKDPEQGIYGTGHNSVLQSKDGKDWYIVYHRFTRPEGIGMGDAAGFHREVCIDRLQFNADGSIQQVQPTLEGVKGFARQ